MNPIVTYVLGLATGGAIVWAFASAIGRRALRRGAVVVHPEHLPDKPIDWWRNDE